MLIHARVLTNILLRYVFPRRARLLVTTLARYGLATPCVATLMARWLNPVTRAQPHDLPRHGMMENTVQAVDKQIVGQARERATPRPEISEDAHAHGGATPHPKRAGCHTRRPPRASVDCASTRHTRGHARARLDNTLARGLEWQHPSRQRPTRHL